MDTCLLSLGLLYRAKDKCGTCTVKRKRKIVKNNLTHCFYFIFLCSDYSFYSNRNLTYVNLEWNRIETLPRQMFHPEIHQSISQVRLSHNKIQTILLESFLSFPAINLDLSYNSIQTVERHAFSTVVLGGQPIPSGVVGNNNKATTGTFSHLDYTNAEFTSASPGNDYYYAASAQTSSSSSSAANVAAAALTSTHPGLNLYLNKNKLTIMKPNALAGEKFALVDLSYNQLVAFNFDTFSRRTLLGGLNISHNSIDRLVVPKNRRFVLKFLDMSFNRLQYRGTTGGMLSVCPSVLLDFSHNRLERTDSKLFPANCSLRVSHGTKKKIAPYKKTLIFYSRLSSNYYGDGVAANSKVIIIASQTRY